MNVIKGARVLFLSHASPSGIGWQSACPGPPVGGVSPQVKRETGTLNIRDWRHLHWKSWQQSPNFLTKNSGAVSLARQQWPCASHFPVSQGICRLSNVKLHLLIFIYLHEMTLNVHKLHFKHLLGTHVASTTLDSANTENVLNYRKFWSSSIV